MSKKIKWGILGTGNIAHKFAEALSVLDDAELVSVGSRSQESADKFAGEFDVANAHSSYEALVNDPEVDVIYISTPHPYHFENTMLCLHNGKNVLCEKPFALNEGQVQKMIDKAKENDLFLMEAMWMAYFPAIAKIRELIASGIIGDVKLVDVKFCFRCGWNPEHRLLNKDLGGGALLDVGVYTLAFNQLIYGKEPVDIATLPVMGDTGVDEMGSIILSYEEGALSVLTSAVRLNTPHEALICGTEGMIKIPPLFWQPDKFILVKDGKEEEMSFERIGNGYCFEAIEVTKCLNEGKKQSDLISWDESLKLIRTMDRVRKMWGLAYPRENH